MSLPHRNSLRMLKAMIMMMTLGVAPCQAASYCKLYCNSHGSCIGELNNGAALCTTQDGTTLNVLPFYAGNNWIKRTDPGTGAWEMFILNKQGPVAPGYASSGPVVALCSLHCHIFSLFVSRVLSGPGYLQGTGQVEDAWNMTASSSFIFVCKDSGGPGSTSNFCCPIAPGS